MRHCCRWGVTVVLVGGRWRWVVGGINLSCQNKEAQLFTSYPRYGLWWWCPPLLLLLLVLRGCRGGGGGLGGGVGGEDGGGYAKTEDEGRTVGREQHIESLMSF